MTLLASCLFTVLSVFFREHPDSVMYPQNYFKPPLNIPLLLAGNYGEPRKGHFHAGLDLQTQQQEGLPVLAAADGYISRINISAVGYGNALYITHPNGYVTVYGHLKELIPVLAQRLTKEQYAKKQFAIDIELKAGEYTVRQGQQIAWSGSTGSSGGPHLHFEIRDSLECPINPMLFGIKISDATPPLVNGLRFYPMDSLKFKSDGYRSRLIAKGGKFEVAGGSVRLNCKTVGLAVSTYDLMDKVENKLGIYTLKLFDNDTLIYDYQVDRMSFKEGRYVLSQVDYPTFLTEDEETYHKCFVEPGNKCPVYKHLKHKGIIDLSDGGMHVLRVEAGDFNGNISVINAKVQYDEKSNLVKEKESPFVQIFYPSDGGEYISSDFKMSLPAGSLFDTLHFNYSASLSTNADVYSKEHLLNPALTGFFDWFHVAVKTERLNPRFNDKAVIVFKDEKGNEFSRGGIYKDGYVTAKVREFGLCYIKIDTIPPRIIPVNIVPGKNMKKSKTILFKITDNLSGIGAFNTYIDDHWVETDYDAKSSSLIYKMDNELKSGEHRFKVVVEDERHNNAIYSIKFNM